MCVPTVVIVGSRHRIVCPAGGCRREDIRVRDSDKVNVGDSFRPGDVVLAKVLAFVAGGGGGGRFSLRLSTAGERLGCVHGRSHALLLASSCGNTTSRTGIGRASPGAMRLVRGCSLSPLNWEEMQCSATGIIEKRKFVRPTTQSSSTLVIISTLP